LVCDYFASVWLQSIVMSMSVCLSARITRKPCSWTLPNILCCCVWPWLDSSLTQLQYIMYFRFYEWRHVFIPWDQRADGLR